MKSGCYFCEKFWFNYPNGRPYPLVENIFERYKLYQCSECKTFWEDCFRSARVIKETTAYKMF
jgi:hypothetical protein